MSRPLSGAAAASARSGAVRICASRLAEALFQSSADLKDISMEDVMATARVCVSQEIGGKSLTKELLERCHSISISTLMDQLYWQINRHPVESASVEEEDEEDYSEAEPAVPAPAVDVPATMVGKYADLIRVSGDMLSSNFAPTPSNSFMFTNPWNSVHAASTHNWTFDLAHGVRHNKDVIVDVCSSVESFLQYILASEGVLDNVHLMDDQSNGLVAARVALVLGLAVRRLEGLAAVVGIHAVPALPAAVPALSASAKLRILTHYLNAQFLNIHKEISAER